MRFTRRHLLLSPAVVAAVLGLAGCATTTGSAPTDELWIRSARIVDARGGDSAGVADILIRDGRIASVLAAGSRRPPKRARVVEAAGRWLAPGPFDSHVHVSSVPGLTSEDTEQTRHLRDLYRDQVGRSYLLHGFTQVVDLNLYDPGTIEWFATGGPAPDLLHAGAGLTMAGGYPLVFVPEAERWGYPNFLLDPRTGTGSPPPGVDPAEHTPEAAVARVAAAGGIAVKVFWETGFGDFSDLPTPSRETLGRITDAAGEHDLPVLAHANSLTAWDFVTQSPIDAIVHGMWNWGPHRGAEGLPAEIGSVIDRTVAAGIAVMPTTRVMGGLGDLFDPAFLDDPRVAAVYPPAYLEWLDAGGGELREEMRGDFDGLPDAQIRAVFEGGRDQGDRVLRAYVERGGRLVFGSDTPSAPIPTNPPGLNGRLELEHFAAIGLAPLAVARALTVAPAELFGVEEDYGEVAVGRKANLLLLRSDPLASIAAWGEIEAVVLGGRVLDPDQLRADR